MMMYMYFLHARVFAEYPPRYVRSGVVDCSPYMLCSTHQRASPSVLKLCIAPTCVVPPSRHFSLVSQRTSLGIALYSVSPLL